LDLFLANKNTTGTKYETIYNNYYFDGWRDIHGYNIVVGRRRVDPGGYCEKVMCNKVNNTVTGLQYYIVGSLCTSSMALVLFTKSRVGPPSCVEKSCDQFRMRTNVFTVCYLIF
jgi:hypothetical protein